MKTLTKSLHTVTAATNVARYLVASGNPDAMKCLDARDLAALALDVLGYDIREYPAGDMTITKIIRECGIVGSTVRIAA